MSKKVSSSKKVARTTSERNLKEAKTTFMYPQIRLLWERLNKLHVQAKSYVVVLDEWVYRLKTLKRFPENMWYNPPPLNAGYGDIGYKMATQQGRVGLLRRPVEDAVESLEMMKEQGDSIADLSSGSSSHDKALHHAQRILRDYGSVDEWASAKEQVHGKTWDLWAAAADALYVHARKFQKAVSEAYKATDQAQAELDRPRASVMERAIPIRQAIGALESAAWFDCAPDAIPSLPTFRDGDVEGHKAAMKEIWRLFRSLRQEALDEEVGKSKSKSQSRSKKSSKISYKLDISSSDAAVLCNCDTDTLNKARQQGRIKHADIRGRVLWYSRKELETNEWRRGPLFKKKKKSKPT